MATIIRCCPNPLLCLLSDEALAAEGIYHAMQEVCAWWP